jgi:hypothetical protein
MTWAIKEIRLLPESEIEELLSVFLTVCKIREGLNEKWLAENPWYKGIRRVNNTPGVHAQVLTDVGSMDVYFMKSHSELEQYSLRFPRAGMVTVLVFRFFELGARSKKGQFSEIRRVFSRYVGRDRDYLYAKAHR